MNPFEYQNSATKFQPERLTPEIKTEVISESPEIIPEPAKKTTEFHSPFDHKSRALPFPPKHLNTKELEIVSEKPKPQNLQIFKSPFEKHAPKLTENHLLRKNLEFHKSFTEKEAEKKFFGFFQSGDTEAIINFLSGGKKDTAQEKIDVRFSKEISKLREKYKRELHINTVTLTAFWKELREGDPVIINILRSGQPLIDHGGFFSPLKILLRRGKIKPTPEAIFIAMQRAPMHLNRSRFAVLGAVEGLYWAMVDSAHAALMAAGHTPPSPEHVYDMLEKVFGKNMNRKFRDYFKEMYSLAHGITHGNVKLIHGKQVDELRNKTEDFVEEMRRHVKKLT